MIATFASLAIVLSGQGGTRIPDWVAPFEKSAQSSGLVPTLPDGLWSPRPPTRYDSAVLVHAAYMGLKERMRPFDSKEKPDGKVEKWWFQVDGLIAMMREFRPELVAMGATDVELFVKDLRRYQSILANVGSGGAISPTWVAPTVKSMQRNGLAVGFATDLVAHGRPMKRNDYAKGTYATYEHMKRIFAEPHLELEPTSSFDGWSQGLADLGKLVTEFRQELTAMQVFEAVPLSGIHAEIAKFRSRVSELHKDMPPFADVAPTHWGASAIRDLKEAGLIKGYPSGRFGG